MIPIVWGVQEVEDPHVSITMDATVDGVLVRVQFSVEVIQDKGRERCKQRAEELLRALHAKGSLPKRLGVTNRDFGG